MASLKSQLVALAALLSQTANAKGCDDYSEYLR